MIEALMNEQGFLQSSFHALVAGCLVLVWHSGLSEERIRTWTSDDGRRIQASLLQVTEEGALLKLANGREALVPLDRLSSLDREFLETADSVSDRFIPGTLPDETTAPSEIEVTGGPERYLTPHFAFESGDPVSKAFISEAARIYEGTFTALSAIPHGLTFSPPEGSSHFQGAFMDDARFDRIASQRMGSIPGQRIVGLYLGDEQRLLVPYSSLGAKQLGSRLTLRKSSDTTTLVHEIVHQVMHRYLPVLPTWFSEGIAEYVSAVPYQNGRFEFRNSERGLKERLKEEYRSAGRTVEGVIPPSSFLAGSGSLSATEPGLTSSSVASSGAVDSSAPRSWSGTVKEYRDALLLVYFFMHLDEPENEGGPIGRFLNTTHRALGETDSILTEIEQFEASRLAYNREVQRFNEAIDVFRAAAKTYNERIKTYNLQVKEGVPEGERIEVGEPPEEPAPPTTLEVPERLRKLSQGGGQINLVSLVEKRALSELLRGRNPGSIDSRMKEEFATIGLEINYLQ